MQRLLGEEILSFNALRVLIAQSIVIPSVFDGINNSLWYLEVVDMSKNRLVALPDRFCALVNLIKANLSMNGIAKLPIDIGNLTKTSI